MGEEIALEETAEGAEQEVTYRFIAYDEGSKKWITIAAENNSNTDIWKATTAEVSNTATPINNTSAPTQRPTDSQSTNQTTGSYNVTVSANGGNIAGIDKVILEWDKTKNYEELPKSTRKGYLFDGWYTAREGGEKIIKSTIGKVSENSTIYAHWTHLTLSKVKMNSAKRSGKIATVKWKKVDSASGYQISYSLYKDFRSNTKKTVTVTKKKITGLISNKTYYFKVRAYAVDSTGKKVYGAWSKVKKVK